MLITKFNLTTLPKYRFYRSLTAKRRYYSLLAILLFCALEIHATASDEPNKEKISKIVQLVFQQDLSVFKNTYIYEAFGHWITRNDFNNHRLETIINKVEFWEVHLSKVNQSADNNNKLIILFSKDSLNQVVEFRKQLEKMSDSQPPSNYLIEFIERFAWFYETGRNNFVRDLVFPNFVKMQYKGLKEKTAILQELRQQFKRTLPVKSISWENRGTYFLIVVKLESTIEPLEIALDLKRYLTTLYYDRLNLSDRVVSLKDSINVWQHKRIVEDDAHTSIINSTSESEAIESYITDYFGAYDVSVIEKNNKSQTIQLIWPYAESSSPSIGRYYITANSAGEGRYRIKTSWIPQNFDAIAKENNSSALAKIINSALCYFQSPKVSSSGNIHWLEKRDVDFQVKLHDLQTRIYDCKNFREFDNVVRNFSKGRPKYIRFQSVIISQDTLKAHFIIVWDEKGLHICHFAELLLSFKLEGKKQALQKAELDIYPFIRTDHLKIIAPLSKKNSPGVRNSQIKIILPPSNKNSPHVRNSDKEKLDE